MYFLKIYISKKYIKKKYNMSYLEPVWVEFLITQFSVFITHNLKMVGLIAKSLFGKQ